MTFSAWLDSYCSQRGLDRKLVLEVLAEEFEGVANG